MQEIALWRDEGFRNGFRVLGGTHEEGYVGELRWGTEKGSCEWSLAQWASRCNIAAGRREGNAYFTPSQTVKCYCEDGYHVLELELRASREYEGPRKAGEDWPHLLLGQEMGERCPSLDRLESLEFLSEVRIGYCNCGMEAPDPELHAAQANLFLTISHMETENMYWFGIPYYDSRYPMQGAYLAEDGGKEDASHKMIYIIPQERLTDRGLGDCRWTVYRRDILPDILEGLWLGAEKGFLETAGEAGYRISSMNFGWEMPGSYDANLLIRRLSLTGRLR